MSRVRKPGRDGRKPKPSKPPEASKPAKAPGRPARRARRQGAGSAAGTGLPSTLFAPARAEVEALPAAQLRWVCPPIRPSKTPPGATRLLGQERPMRALRTGLQLHAPGYNVLLTGLVGSGRTTVVRHLLQEMQPACRLGPDRVFVTNFNEPHRPRLVNLPRGEGPRFRDALDEFLRRLHDSLVDALRSRPHKASRRVVMREAEERELRLMGAVESEARRAGCTVVMYDDPQGEPVTDLHPIVAGEAVPPARLDELVAEKKLSTREAERLHAARDELSERLEEAIDRVRRVRRDADHELRRVDRVSARRIIDRMCDEFCRDWPQPGVSGYLTTASEHIERNLERWAAPDEPSTEAGGPGAPAAQSTPQEVAAMRAEELGAHVVKTSADDVCPIVVETNPTYQNLFGTIEAREGEPSRLPGIHPGSLVRADGGYLILRMGDALTEPGVWKQLKRALMSGSVELREFDPNTGSTTGTLQPEAIPIDLKVVLIGDPGSYEHLAAEDPQFRQHFKIHAEFDASIPVNADNLRRYADFLGWMVRNERLRPFTPEANAAVAELGARLAGRNDRLTTQFGDLADIAREASYLTGEAGAGPVQASHVHEALRLREQRHDLIRELAERDFEDGYLLLRTSGRAVGQVNGLTVLDTGSLVFGKPCRITASTGASTENDAGLINIEREADLSGSLHDKGVLILQGFLLDHFGADGPLQLQAAICFEQTYSGVDGDSASSAELLALLSSLARVPLEQGIAITGALNQKGELQPVGALNEKIEGFFRLCRTRRLTGKQGVIVPRGNVADLMLAPEVVAAAAEGWFHIWAVDDVFAALTLMAGVPASEVMAKAAETLARYRAR